MQKITKDLAKGFSKHIAVAAVICTAMATPFIAGAVGNGHDEGNRNTEPAPITITETEVMYDPTTNYMEIMIQCAAKGDTYGVLEALYKRNAKVADTGTDSTLTYEQFMESFEAYAGFSLETDYLAEMMGCCVAGDIETGIQLAEERVLKQAALGAPFEKIEFEDLYILSKIIHNEAGSSWLSMEWKMKVGEVFLNRVESPEFPNSVRECAYQKGQYERVGTKAFERMTPSEDSTEAAVRLLEGERLLNNPAVVFQSNHKNGYKVYEKMHDEYLGDTYLCLSPNQALYD